MLIKAYRKNQTVLTHVGKRLNEETQWLGGGVNGRTWTTYVTCSSNKSAAFFLFAFWHELSHIFYTLEMNKKKARSLIFVSLFRKLSSLIPSEKSSYCYCYIYKVTAHTLIDVVSLSGTTPGTSSWRRSINNYRTTLSQNSVLWRRVT